MMHKMKELARDLNDEIKGAEHYAKMAAKFKASDTELCRAFHSMAKQELGHATTIYEQMSRFVRDAEAKDAAAKEGIQAIWEVVQEWTTEWMAHVRIMLE